MMEADSPASAHMRAQRAVVAAQLSEAIRTLAALPDRERAFLAPLRSAWPEPLCQFWDQFGRAVAGGYERPRLRPQPPSPQAIDRMLPTLAWLVWLDARDCKLVFLRAFGVSWWKIGARFDRSEKTVQRWHDQAIDRIVGQLARQARPGRAA